MHDGYVTLFRWNGVPVRVHWSVPLGAVMLGRMQLVPGFWLGFVLLLLVHEAGHAAMIRANGSTLLGIDLHALGGGCQWTGSATRVQRAVIAWGGVWAQLVLLAATYAAVSMGHTPHAAWVGELVSAFTVSNIILIAINLLPIAPLDGHQAWPLVPALWRRWARRRARARVARVRVDPPTLAQVDALVGHGLETSRQADDLIERAMRAPRASHPEPNAHKPS